METLQRGRRDASESIAKPIQAKEKAGKGAGFEGPEAEGEDVAAEAAGGGEGGQGEGGEAGEWSADGGLMSAMGLPELGAEGEGGQGGGAEGGAAGEKKEGGKGDKQEGASAAGTAPATDRPAGASATAEQAREQASGAAGQKSKNRKKKKGAPKGTASKTPGGANSISARAFTSGNNIHMGAGESASDSKLMSHELAHTIQQTSAAKVADGVSSAGDSLEVEADRVADAAVSGGQATVTTGAGGSTLMRDAVSDVEKLLSYGAFDWAITDDEATQALAILAALPQAGLTAALGRLGQTYKTRLLDNLPEAAKRTSGYTKVLVALGPDAVLPYVQGLLSYGVFDWAVTDAEAAEVFGIIKAIGAGQQAVLTTKLGATFRARLSSNLKRASVIGPDEYALLRVMFDATPAAEAQTLCNWTALRFNLKVAESTDSAGVLWDKPGLTRVWNVLQALPPEHVESNGDLKSLTRYRGNGISGWASSTGEAAIGYGATSNIDTTTNNSQAGDPLNGVNRFDKVVRHEVGHRVDASVGGPAYCATDPGGGWQRYDKGSVASSMVTASAGKISTWGNADQKRAIIECLQGIVNDRKPAEIDKRLERLDFVKDHATDAAQATLLADIKGDGAVTQLAQCFEDQSPWYSLATGGTALGGKIFQESYTNNWTSYKADARTRKLSQYQFRAPEEWFAEAYAAYYEPPGVKGALLSGRDPATKTWFDTSVDPQHGAGGTVPPAPGAAPAAPAGAPAGGP